MSAIQLATRIVMLIHSRMPNAVWTGDRTAAEEISDILKPLVRSTRPLVEIANAYDKNGLDEARPEWVAAGVGKPIEDVEPLVSGRGGKTLLTLEDCIDARKAVRVLF